ncbi:hypothetical protein LX87_00738 [Larkinella arboricola]|uniref:Uncharacterized protein n=1 Tax=Larkinella arboricola TaxID=643671 RepID=A0A327X8Q1_LARAB|nr:hypothetical protein [Larkinella arboricola]RAK02618.1 hypothetical protein LX87_00738 [Larkinella arboricola]
MKWLLFVALIGISLTSQAQLPATGKRVYGPVTTKRGIVLKEGDQVRFGEGGLASGGYQHIYLTFDKFGQKAETAHLEEGYAYKYATIKEFREVGSGSDRRLVALIRPKGGVSIHFRAVDLEPAMQSKEIISINGTAISKLISKKQI